MENNVISVVLAVFLFIASCYEAKLFRPDYEYNSRTDSFYKLHTEKLSGRDSSKQCLAEGTALMVPSSPLDITQLHGMFKKYPDLGDYVWVGLDGGSHESAEEQPIIRLDGENDDIPVPFSLSCDLVTREGKIESLPCFRRLPFVCKVQARDVPYDQHCDVYAHGYHYYGSVGSCYKIPRMAGTWYKAYDECRAENAHLLIINSETERAVIEELLKTTMNVQEAQAPYFFHAGFRADPPVGNATAVFKTIFNQTLEEAGFAAWAADEPNNALGNEYCGTVFKNDGKLNDIVCSDMFAFVCEKERKRA